MDTQTIKKAIESKKAYNHLVNWALNKNCSISVFVEGEPEIEKSKDFEEQKQLLEVHKNLKEIEREITKQIGTVIFK